MTEDLTFIGIRAESAPYVPSVTRPCSACGRDLWVDKKLVSIADAAPKRLCVPCATLAFKEN